MKTDAERRVTAALRSIVDDVECSAPPVSVLRARVRGPEGAVRRWRTPVLAATVVLVLLALVGVLPGIGIGGRGASPGIGAADRPTLPAEFAGMSLLTASVSAAPPGPAIAVYRLGVDGIRHLTTQTVVLGADGRTQRRLDLAEERGAVGPDGEWSDAESLLSPDGALVAVTDRIRVRDHIEVVDLRTGKVRRYALDVPSAVLPLAWSRESRWLAVAVNDGPLDGSAGRGGLAVLDVREGTLRRLPGLGPSDVTQSAAFSPEGLLAATAPDGRTIVIVDVTGKVRRTVPLPERYYLTGHTAWSPDGRLLAVERIDGERIDLAFLDLTAEPAKVSAPLQFAPGRVILAWRSSDTLLVGPGYGDGRIAEMPVDGSPSRTISHLPGGLSDGRALQLAEGLVPEAQVAAVGSAERGPWPRWWRVIVSALVLLVGWRLFLLIRRRRNGAGRLDPG